MPPLSMLSERHNVFLQNNKGGCAKDSFERAGSFFGRSASPRIVAALYFGRNRRRLRSNWCRPVAILQKR